jgi:hypothetical protein
VGLDPWNRFAPRFGMDGLEARPRQRPKLGLPLLKAARQYRDALDGSASDRRDLIAAALGRCGSAAAALHALNELAASFGLPAFDEAELAGR